MKRAYFKYIFALLLFGSNGILAVQILLSSYEIVLFRTLIGSALLIAIFVLARGKLTYFKQPKQQSLFITMSGVAMGASWMFLYEAYQQVGVGIASLAYCCGPVVVMALSPILFREKLRLLKVIGFITVLFGILLVSDRAYQDGATVWGLFCGGMSAVTYAAMVICNKKAKNIVGLENAMLQLFFGFLTVAVFVGVRQGYSINVAHGDWLPILILGLVNTGIGCYLYFSSIGRLPIQTVAICGYLELLSAVIFSVLILHESMQPVQILGAALILGGAVFAESVAK